MNTSHAKTLRRTMGATAVAAAFAVGIPTVATAAPGDTKTTEQSCSGVSGQACSEVTLSFYGPGGCSVSWRNLAENTQIQHQARGYLGTASPFVGYTNYNETGEISVPHDETNISYLSMYSFATSYSSVRYRINAGNCSFV